MASRKTLARRFRLWPRLVVVPLVLLTRSFEMEASDAAFDGCRFA